MTDKVKYIILEIAPEILVDVMFDKFAGQIPVVGIYFNAICAKNMTCRLGVLFTMLAARGEEINQEKISDSMKLIRAAFPQEGFWKFARPAFSKFESLCASFQDISKTEYNARVDRKLAEMKVADL
ncbi:MAG: hypothetical protein LBU32_23515 [Clostridiales bacterium]|jgi:glutaminase|nr:hypothetical protein [Clostridiales bacterium]